MAYMLLQRYTTSIHDAYADRSDLMQQLAEDWRCQDWLEALDIDARPASGLRGADRRHRRGVP